MNKKKKNYKWLVLFILAFLFICGGIIYYYIEFYSIHRPRGILLSIECFPDKDLFKTKFVLPEDYDVSSRKINELLRKYGYKEEYLHNKKEVYQYRNQIFKRKLEPELLEVELNVLELGLFDSIIELGAIPLRIVDRANILPSLILIIFGIAFGVASISLFLRKRKK